MVKGTTLSSRARFCSGVLFMLSANPRTRMSLKISSDGGIVTGCLDIAPYVTMVPPELHRQHTPTVVSSGVIRYMQEWLSLAGSVWNTSLGGVRNARPTCRTSLVLASTPFLPVGLWHRSLPPFPRPGSHILHLFSPYLSPPTHRLASYPPSSCPSGLRQTSCSQPQPTSSSPRAAPVPPPPRTPTIPSPVNNAATPRDPSPRGIGVCPAAV